MTAHNTWPLLFVMLLFSSCSESSETVEMKDLDGNWNKKAEQKFSLNISDAQAPKNIIFVVRNNNDYPYSNLRLITKISSGKNIIETDTLNYVLAKPNGEWLGSGFGDTKEILFQYKLNYKFPKNGEYSLGIIQAMRTDNLKGIEDIGVKLETPKP